MRLTSYLPLLLALSTSSPFWQGQFTGLRGYRLAAYDELPRTGLPELFRTKQDYDQFVAALVWAKIIPDASYIWWAIRPSLENPTVELRVADSCTRLDDAVAIAALFLAPRAAAYSWPLKPFNKQHPVRGTFGDPRYHLGAEGSLSAFHFGVDIAAPDGTPVYAVEGPCAAPT